MSERGHSQNCNLDSIPFRMSLAEVRPGEGLKALLPPRVSEAEAVNQQVEHSAGLDSVRREPVDQAVA